MEFYEKNNSDKKRRVPIGLKIFLGFAGILLYVLIGNVLILSQLSKLNNIIKSTGSGMFRIALSQKLRGTLRQQRSSRALYNHLDHLGEPIERKIAMKAIDDFSDSFERDIKSISKKRNSDVLKELSEDMDFYSLTVRDAIESAAERSAIEANNLITSRENRDRKARIEKGISTARKRYYFSITQNEFVKVNETIDLFIKPLYYIERFALESEDFRAGAESLAVLSSRKDPLPKTISAISDTLRILFEREIESGVFTDDRSWDSVYSALSDTLENILITELSDITTTIEKSRNAVVMTRRFGIWGTLVLSLLGLIIAVTIARIISSPISNLRVATHAAKRGEWESHIEKTTNDEIGDLTDDFNAMLVELGQLDEMKNRFLASITHDLKSPIGRVRGNIANLQDGLLGPITEGQAELFEMMSRDIDKLSRLIHDILDLQKMKAGAFKLDLHSVDMQTFLMESLEQHASEFIKKDIEMGVKLDVEGVSANIDKRQIDRVLDNLITNAIKYTSTDGKIIVEAKIEKNMLVVKVFDNGVGIPKEHLKRVFGEFYQVENKVKTAKGSGLGLAISKQIVEAHRGRIWADSESGIGTYFAFSIPLTPKG